jgi:hypothetical protein
MTDNLIHPPTPTSCGSHIISANDKNIGIPNSDMHIYVLISNLGSTFETFFANECIV